MSLRSNSSQPTVRMPNPTIWMPSSPPTVRMNSGNSVYESDNEQHITIGTVLGDQITLKQVLSEQTGEAALFLCEREDQIFVAKIYHLNKKPKKELYDVLRNVNHPSVLQPIANGEYAGRYYEIIPYFPEGDLEKAAPLGAKLLKNVVVPLINEGLYMLHTHGIVHRDIKPSNLFFSDNRTKVIIGDFGISSFNVNQQSVRYTSGSRTLGYSAPETAQGFVSKESDYYSLGITLLQLATGFDPFAGMTDHQILKITMMDKLDIPLSVDPSVAHLIRGLTVKERADRWGHEELKRWCAGEKVSVTDTGSRPIEIQPYVFQGRSIHDIKELSLALAEQWDESVKHLYRGLISEHIKQFGQDLASSVMDCEEEQDHDVGVFKLIFTLNPEAPLCWKGEVFFDLEALGKAMAYEPAKIQPNYMELLQKGIWLQYVRKGQFEEGLKKEAENLQLLANKEPEIAYYRLYYLLNQTEEWALDGHSFYSVETFVKFLAVHKDDVEVLAKRSLQDPKFWAWLMHLGFDEQVVVWRNMSLFDRGTNL